MSSQQPVIPVHTSLANVSLGRTLKRSNGQQDSLDEYTFTP